MKQGRQEGIQTRSLEIARNMLFKLHLGIDVVQKATHCLEGWKAIQ